MQSGIEQMATASGVETISEDEFKRVCDEIYRDRFEIYGFRPEARPREAVLWMLLGCLISLLSVSHDELSSLAEASSKDMYADAIFKLLQTRAAPPFDARPLVEELLKSVEAE